MHAVKVTREHTERLDADTRKTWPQGWSGQLEDGLAYKVRKANAAVFIGENADDAEKAFQLELEQEQAAVDALVAEAKAAAEAKGKGAKKAEQLV